MLRKLSLATVVTALVLSLAGCKSAKKSDETEVPGGSDMNSGDTNVMGDSDSGQAMGLRTVHFPYDSFDIDSAGQSILMANAEILKANPTVKVQIEGHCDARGGIQYNIALGERRANAVKAYLGQQGIGGDRIATISYGKERLQDTAMSEDAHAKNRRANFAITSR